MTDQEHKAIIADMVKDIKFCMMTFTQRNGHLHACPMTAQEQDPDGKIWYLGSKSSDIVEAIKRNPQVNVAFSKPDAQDFVSFNGEVELLEDEAKVDALWSEMYNAFYEQGRQDPDIQLMCFKPHGAHFWKGQSKPVALFKMAKAAITGDTPRKLGESDSVSYGFGTL